MKNKVEAFKEEEKVLENCITKVDQALSYSRIEEEEDSSGINSNDSSNLRDKLSNTDISSKISDAITNKKYRERVFKEHFINCPVNRKGEMEIYQTKVAQIYPFNRKCAVQTKCPIVMGEQQIRILIQHFDEKLEHEGFGKILEKIKGDKVEIIDLKEEDSQIKQNKQRTFLDSNKPLGKYFDCQQCQMKGTLKGKGKFQNGKIFLKDEIDVQMALEYGDFHHRGFRKAHSRLRSWCTFDDMEKKVSRHFYLFIYSIERMLLV